MLLIKGLCAPSARADLDSAIATADTTMHGWTDKAARGLCGWICADCCLSFPEGMPDACEHGDKRCTEIIQRDKAAAQQPAKDPQ
jgi:hypothetical protein